MYIFSYLCLPESKIEFVFNLKIFCANIPAQSIAHTHRPNYQPVGKYRNLVSTIKFSLENSFAVKPLP